ncbi:MAG: hypothetical protein E4H14_15320 [Candidatus Thorarchaeota archaeon]|nr:MAG: hypothetical protein E4H14_15320 [Candidatus Thorarchaeota archaeon]
MSVDEFKLIQNIAGYSTRQFEECPRFFKFSVAIFIPLTLMASIYGMNWQWIPELDFYYGYPVFMAFMFIIGAGLLGYFRRIGWI